DALAAQRTLAIGANGAPVGPIGEHATGLHVVREVLCQDLVANTAAQLSIFDRENQLDSPVEIARHQVGAAGMNLLIAAVTKIKNPAVLEKAANHARYTDCFAHARNARAQAADPADEQVDLHSGLRGAVEQADHAWIHQRIHLEDQAAIAVHVMAFDLAP